MILRCKGCGSTKPSVDGTPTDFYPSTHCDECPPWVCEECGEMDSAKDHCPCWIDIDQLCLADKKAVFASVGLSLDIRLS